MESKHLDDGRSLFTMPDLSIYAALPEDPDGLVIRRLAAKHFAAVSLALTRPKPSVAEIRESLLVLGGLLLAIGSSMAEAEEALRGPEPVN